MDLEQQLRAALAPCRPGPALRTNVIARVSAGVRTVRGRASARLVLVGMVLAVAAAALMLAASLTRTPAPSAAATATVQVPVANPLSAPGLGAPVVATSPAPAAAAPRPQRVPVQVERQEAASIKPFTVMVLPIENASTEVAVTSAVDTFYRTLLDGLRATPGLMLITPESEEVAARTPADYRLTMKGTGSTQANTFTITLKAAKVGSFVQPYQIIGTIVDEYMLSGTIPPECAATPGCGDAIGMAARQLQLLRDTVFPESPARAQQMRARLVDPELGAQARLDALLALESLRGDDVLSPARPQSAAGRAALRDPAVVRGAIALAAAATQDFVRAQVWKKMRGVGSAELVQPLIAAARIQVETETHRALMTQTWRLTFNRWAQSGRIDIRPAPLRSLVAARVYDSAGVAHMVDLQAFVVDTASATLASVR